MANHRGRISLQPFALYLAPCIVARPAQTIDTIHVGSPSLRVERIQPGVDTLALFARSPSGERPIATLIRTVTATLVGGQRAWLFVQDYRTDRGGNADSSVVLASTLAPVRYASHAAESVESFTFDGRSVVGRVTRPDSAPRDIGLTAAAPVFNSVVDDLMLRALPLRAGYVAAWTSYNPPRGFGTAVVRVTGDTTVETSRGRAQAWVLAYDAGGAPTTILVDRTTARVLRMRSELRGGMVFWKLPAADKRFVP